MTTDALEKNTGMLIDIPQTDEEKAQLAALSSAADYLPRLQFMSGACDLVKSGNFPAQHFGLFESKEPTDMGASVDVIILGFRSKALQVGDEIIECLTPELDADGVPQNATFADIQRRSDIKDSGCMFGPEFLIYISKIKKFATFFCGTKTMRRDAGKFNAYTGKAATFRGKFIEGKKNKWWTTEPVDCTSPIDIPDRDLVMKQIDKFKNPPKQATPEIASEAEAAATGRAQ